MHLAQVRNRHREPRPLRQAAGKGFDVIEQADAEHHDRLPVPPVPCLLLGPGQGFFDGIISAVDLPALGGRRRHAGPSRPDGQDSTPRLQDRVGERRVAGGQAGQVTLQMAHAILSYGVTTGSASKPASARHKRSRCGSGTAGAPSSK